MITTFSDFQDFLSTLGGTLCLLLRSAFDYISFTIVSIHTTKIPQALFYGDRIYFKVLIRFCELAGSVALLKKFH